MYALPRSKLLRFRYSGSPQRHRLGWACVLCSSQVRAAQVTRCLASAVAATYHFPRLCHSVFWMYNWCTFSGRCQLSSIPRSWSAMKPACLVDDASLGPRCPLPALAALTCLSLVGHGLVHSQLVLVSGPVLSCQWA